jgi:tetratricopeptide (TPR) repeat protein
MYNKALQIQLKILPNNHPSFATTYNNIAAVYGGEGNYPKTVEYLKKALTIRLHSLPPHHPDFADIYRNLAVPFYYQGELSQALEYMKKAHEIRSKNFPFDHPSVINDQEWVIRIEDELAEREEQEENS